MRTIYRFWLLGRFVLLQVFGLSVAFAQVDPELAKYTQPPSIESLVTIDGVRIDGSLALTLDLGALQLGPGARFPFHLEHRLASDSGRETRSVWDIPELYGMIAPAGRGALRWRLFGLGEVMIPAVPPGPAYRPVGMGYMMQRTAIGDFSFRNEQGWEWLYRDWTLVVGRGPNGLQLDFQVQGGRITAMTASRYRIAAGGMEARYDEFGRLSRLRVGIHVHEFQYEADSFRLCAWVANAEASPVVMKFSYVDELLSGVQEGDLATRRLGWVALPAGKRSDCIWPQSVGVGRTERYLFEYDHGTKGYVLSAQPAIAGTSKRVTLNNRKGFAIIEENGTVVRRMLFGAKRGEPEAGRLTRIENGEGKVLERYEYDPQGMVAHAWPEGGGRIDFTYDRTGALTSAVNGPPKDE